MLVIDKVLKKIKHKRIEIFADFNRQPAMYSPYCLQDYIIFIEKVKSIFAIQKFDAAVDLNRANFICRFDLDTLSCLKNSSYMVDVHRERNIPVSVFLRMDDLDYSHKEIYNFIRPYLDFVQLGLHSSCYVNDNPHMSLALEIDKFSEIFGFRPNLMTMHGLGTYKYPERVNFVEYLRQEHTNFGIEFADFLVEHRNYDYVIQDCHIDNGRRFLKRDILNLPPSIPGACYLSLSHPCYWTN